jgi:hypothetical protein
MFKDWWILFLSIFSAKEFYILDKYLRKSAEKSAQICGKSPLNFEQILGAEVFPADFRRSSAQISADFFLFRNFLCGLCGFFALVAVKPSCT